MGVYFSERANLRGAKSDKSLLNALLALLALSELTYLRVLLLIHLPEQIPYQAPYRHGGHLINVGNALQIHSEFPLQIHWDFIAVCSHGAVHGPKQKLARPSTKTLQSSPAVTIRYARSRHHHADHGHLLTCTARYGRCGCKRSEEALS
jgi:hypothetical protein